MSLKLGLQSGFAVFEVEDDGIGIAKDRLADIVGLFTQIDAAHGYRGSSDTLAVRSMHHKAATAKAAREPPRTTMGR